MSRNLDDLEPETRARVDAFLAACKDASLDILVTCTFRTFDEQAALYATGRTGHGRVVTNAPAGMSWHNWRRAIDVVPMRDGKPVWGALGPDHDLWQQIGALGKSCGLEWAGEWHSFPEFPHFQFTGGLSLMALNAAHPGGI